MPYTMATYASEVMQRLHRYDVAKMVDMSMLEGEINRARFDVQMATLQAVPERYARIHRPIAVPVVSWPDSARMFEHDMNTGGARVVINQVFVLPLPEDFIIDVSVAVEYEDNQWEARCVSKRDLHTVLTKSFAKPTTRNPVYCIEKFVGQLQSRLLVSIGEDVLPTNKVEIWYLAKLPWLQIENASGTADPEVRIGYDLEELVVLVASLKIMQAIGMPGSATLVRQDIEMMVEALQRQYEGAIDRGRLLVQARESNIPNIPIADANANAMRI
jgi:hypothetical protein